MTVYKCANCGVPITTKYWITDFICKFCHRKNIIIREGIKIIEIKLEDRTYRESLTEKRLKSKMMIR